MAEFSITVETAITPASRASDEVPVSATRRCDRAASPGVSGAGWVLDSTGVSPPEDSFAVLAPRMPEATPLRAAPPSNRFLTRARAGALSSAFSFSPPSLHARTVAAMAAELIALKRPHDSLRTRPRSLLSLMRFMVGFKAACPKRAPPNHVARPRLWAMLAAFDGCVKALLLSRFWWGTYVPPGRSPQ